MGIPFYLPPGIMYMEIIFHSRQMGKYRYSLSVKGNSTVFLYWMHKIKKAVQVCSRLNSYKQFKKLS